MKTLPFDNARCSGRHFDSESTKCPERDRLKSKAAESTMARLCYLHKVSHHTVMAEIDRMRGIAA